MGTIENNMYYEQWFIVFHIIHDDSRRRKRDGEGLNPDPPIWTKTCPMTSSDDRNTTKIGKQANDRMDKIKVLTKFSLIIHRNLVR